MKAAVLRAVGPLSIEEVSIGHPHAREVLIRTSAAGVCRSDLHMIEGLSSTPLPAILGHESAGVVEEVGSEVRDVKPGDHVVTCLSVSCGDCEFCATGRPYNCERPEATRRNHGSPRLSIDGEPVHQFYDLSSFAEWMLVHENAVVKIRDEMPLDRAALLGCAVITGYGSVVRTAAIEPGSTVAVIGCGGVGLSAINAAAIAGAERIIAVDVHEAKLDLAKRFGATDLVDATVTDPVEVVKGLTSGGVAYAFEALGRKQTAEQSFRMLRVGGVATIIGMLPDGETIEVSADDLLYDRKLQGSNMGSNQFRVDVPKLVDLYLDGRLKLDELISRRVSLAQINDTFDEMKGGEIARSVVVFD